MVEFFEDLGNYAVSNHIGFRVLFSSRHYPHITIRKGLDMDLDSQKGHLEDIEKYVDSRLKISANHRREITAQIQERESGGFIWVVLVVGSLNRSHDEGRPFSYIRKQLSDIPDGLTELFRDITMREPHRRDELLLCLQWILFAGWPLTPTELFCAVNSGAGLRPLDAFELGCCKPIAEAAFPS